MIWLALYIVAGLFVSAKAKTGLIGVLIWPVTLIIAAQDN